MRQAFVLSARLARARRAGQHPPRYEAPFSAGAGGLLYAAKQSSYTQNPSNIQSPALRAAGEILLDQAAGVSVFLLGSSYIVVGIYLLRKVSMTRGRPEFYLGLALLMDGFSYGCS